nr:2OG-Fe dioxygenase family protein [Mycobacterium sp. 1274761.0]
MLSSQQLSSTLGVEAIDWPRFARHWEALAPDSYAAELGINRLRRYGHFQYSAADGSVRLLPHDEFVQPENSNPLYIDRGRAFEPLTAAFAKDPLLHRLLTFLGGIAITLDDAAVWSAKVTPFRVLSTAGGAGDPTPEGLHRDGVTLVTSLLIGRENASGGQSTVCDPSGTPLLQTTLREPGTMLVGDDRCTLHRVSPIRPLDPARPARRDVLVVTFTPYR